jgi:hypothetical protein
MLIRLQLVIAFALSLQFAPAQSPTSDPQGVELLRQTLSRSGMTTNPFSSFTAQGTITYFWAGQPVTGSATIRARGHSQFRLDANLPDGVRSISTSRQGGSRKGPDGKVSHISAHNTINAGIVTLPYPTLAAQLEDPDAVITYEGQSEIAGRTVHQVSVARRFPEDADPDGLLAALSRADYLIDAQSMLVVRVEDLTHPVESMTESYPHAIEFEEYAAAGGIAVPSLVREKVGGQTTWEFRLSDIRFNSNLLDGDFSLQ